MSDNATQQTEEVEALCAIYGSDWKKEHGIDDSYCMQITREVHLFITFNQDYPSNRAPSYQLLAPTLTGEQKQRINAEFDEIYRSNLGGPVLFQWIEKLKEVVNDQNVNTEVEQVQTNVDEEEKGAQNYAETTFNIIHGSIIKDRKSTFQGHACSVENQQQVKEVMDLLLENKKIAQATHNILAYRIMLANGSLLQDCDDDGETHAGGRLLHLLQILDVTNVMVVVTRWYGGIHLGPDRFRHINNSARQVLEQAGFLRNKTA